MEIEHESSYSFSFLLIVCSLIERQRVVFTFAISFFTKEYLNQTDHSTHRKRII